MLVLVLSMLVLVLPVPCSASFRPPFLSPSAGNVVPKAVPARVQSRTDNSPIVVGLLSYRGRTVVQSWSDTRRPAQRYMFPATRGSVPSGFRGCFPHFSSASGPAWPAASRRRAQWFPVYESAASAVAWARRCPSGQSIRPGGCGVAAAGADRVSGYVAAGLIPPSCRCAGEPRSGRSCRAGARRDCRPRRSGRPRGASPPARKAIRRCLPPGHRPCGSGGRFRR